MACDPHPATGTTHPMACHPNCSRSWAHYPSAWHPYVVGSGPSPVAACPKISRSRCHRLRFNPNWRRTSSHHYLSGWTCRRHFLCGCRRCDCRWLLGAADQGKWCQCQYANAYSHIRLLFMDSFRSRDSALCELAMISRPRENRPRNPIAESGF